MRRRGSERRRSAGRKRGRRVGKEEKGVKGREWD